jgi:hypothetical protein
MKVACFAGSSLREIAFGLRCSRKAMQQRDQSRPGLVCDAECRFDPCPDMACRAWQGLGHPGFQLLLLVRRKPAGATFVAEAGQALDPVFLIPLIPSPDRVVVEEQHLGDQRTTHPLVQQHQRVGAPRQPMHGGAVTGQFDQVAA